MGEVDFTRLCRAARFPEPDRQVIRRSDRGRAYLDAYWDAYGVVAEVEGMHHEWESNQVADTSRQNESTLSGDAGVQIPV